MLLLEPQLLALLKLIKTDMLSSVGTFKRLNFPLQAMNDFNESYFVLGAWFKGEALQHLPNTVRNKHLSALEL